MATIQTFSQYSNADCTCSWQHVPTSTSFNTISGKSETPHSVVCMQHNLTDSHGLNVGVNCRSGVTESDKFYPPHWKTSELNPQTGRHAGASGGLYMQEIGTRGSSTRGSSSAKSGKSKSVIFDLGLHTRMPLRSEDSCSPPGSVCASTPKFIGLKAVIVAPSSAGKYDPGGIHSSDKLVPAEVSDTPPGPTLEEQSASLAILMLCAPFEHSHPQQSTFSSVNSSASHR